MSHKLARKLAWKFEKMAWMWEFPSETTRQARTGTLWHCYPSYGIRAVCLLYIYVVLLDKSLTFDTEHHFIMYATLFTTLFVALLVSQCCKKKANKKQRFTSCRSGKACASYPPSIQVAVAMWSIDVWEKNSRSLVLNGSFVVYGNPPNKMVGLFQSSMVGFPILPIGQVWSKWTSWGNMKNVFQCFRVIGIIISNAKYWWFGKYTDFQK